MKPLYKSSRKTSVAGRFGGFQVDKPAYSSVYDAAADACPLRETRVFKPSFPRKRESSDFERHAYVDLPGAKSLDSRFRGNDG